MERMQEAGGTRRWAGICPRDLITAVVIGVVVVGIVYALNWEGAGAGDSRSVDVAFNTAFPAPRVDAPATDFGVTGLDGKTFRLSDFKGQPVWLNFWATWCPPCRAEMPDINAVYAEYAPKGLNIVALSLGEDAETVRQYVQKADMKFTIGLDSRREIAAIYRLAGIPTHIFIDKDGIIRDIQIGGMSRDLMKKKLSKIM